MSAKVALITRGFEQQYDYNVLEALKPFGADRHARMMRLAARLTSKNDYEFSFAVDGDGSRWELLLSSVPSSRRDFVGSPLRTYLWLSGDGADKDFAADTLVAALMGAYPKEVLGEAGPLSQALDAVLTPTIVDGLAKRGKEASLNPVEWGDKTLVSALRSGLKGIATSASAQGKVPDSLFASAKTLFAGGSGRITGEYSPFLDDPMKDDPNMTYHFPDGKMIRIRANGVEEPVLPKQEKESRPISPDPAFPTPGSGKSKLAIIGFILLIVSILVIRSCVKDKEIISQNPKEQAGTISVEETQATNPPMPLLEVQ